MSAARLVKWPIRSIVKEERRERDCSLTTDADAYQRLTRALDAHRGDAEAYRRLGAQMTARRHLLGSRYGNRRQFVRERLLPLGLRENAAYKLVYDLDPVFAHGISLGEPAGPADIDVEEVE
jgi:hypothetical protein